MNTKPDSLINPTKYNITYDEKGLTKREYFAAMAMQGLIASCTQSYPSRSETAQRAIEYADALIKKLNGDK